MTCTILFFLSLAVNNLCFCLFVAKTMYKITCSVKVHRNLPLSGSVLDNNIIIWDWDGQILQERRLNFGDVL